MLRRWGAFEGLVRRRGLRFDHGIYGNNGKYEKPPLIIPIIPMPPITEELQAAPKNNQPTSYASCTVSRTTSSAVVTPSKT